jgi:hypothetical protein
MLRFVHFAVTTAQLAPIVLPSALASVRKAGPPTNEQGMPVKDESGGRINYGRDELAARTTPPDVRTSDRESSAFEPPAGVVEGADSHQPPSGVTARWGYAAFGTGIGHSNIVLADGEILAGGGQLTFGANDYWYALRPLGAGYEQVFVSRPLPALVGLAVGDVTGDARKEVVAACANGTVVLFDLRSRVELATLAVAASNVEGMALHDLDGDGKQEILLTTSRF